MLSRCCESFIFTFALISEAVSCKIRILWQILHEALQTKIFIFLFFYVTVVTSTLKLRTNSTSVRNEENKRVRLAPLTYKKSFVSEKDN